MFAERLRVAGSEMTDKEKIVWMREAQTRVTLPTVRQRYEAASVDESVDQLTRFSDQVVHRGGGRLRRLHAGGVRRDRAGGLTG